MNKKDWTPEEWDVFFSAAQKGSAKKLSDLLEKYPALGAERFVDLHENQKTALMFAAERGSLECVRALLPFSDAKATDLHGMTALAMAAGSKNEEDLEGVNIDALSEMSLIVAHRDAQPAACVRELLPRSDAKQANFYQLTPLMAAVSQKNFDCVRELAAFSDVDACNREGKTALILAVEPRVGLGWDERIVDFLLPLSDAQKKSENRRFESGSASAFGHALGWGNWASANKIGLALPIETAFAEAKDLRESASNPRIQEILANLEKHDLQKTLSDQRSNNGGEEQLSAKKNRTQRI